VDLGLAAGALFLLAIVAFRRARGVLNPTARRAAARQAMPAERAGTRSRRITGTVLTVARAAVGVAALVGIVWLAWELFR
jgi:hypothetical protein